ncbi:MAG: NAD-dependent epimerase/dehydratase family protein, partial [Rhodospirillales bacterium]
DRAQTVLGQAPLFHEGDLRDYALVERVLTTFKPDTVVHLAEMPSAPFSMIDREHAIETHDNNLVGTLNLIYGIRDHCPHVHLLKLGTMGEYGTPNIDIPEGFFEVEFRGRKDVLPFPRQPFSMYHLTKVHDSNNIQFACKVWGLRSTDIMQGVVFGTRLDAMQGDPGLATRFDFDEAFGTAINRFCAQAVIGQPLTPYGKGGQTRGFLPLRDSIQCFTLAIENPPEAGEYRVFNQFEETYSVYDLANMVAEVARDLGLAATVRPLENPRIEREEHYFKPDHAKLLDLGYQPNHDIKGEMALAIKDLIPHRARIQAHMKAITPAIHWNGPRETCHYLVGKESRSA